MQASCFKEAQVMVEGLLMLGKRLMARTPGDTGVGGGGRIQ